MHDIQAQSKQCFAHNQSITFYKATAYVYRQYYEYSEVSYICMQNYGDKQLAHEQSIFFCGRAY